MHITLNGDRHEVETGSTLASLIDSLDLSGKRIAVEVNEALVPRGEHSTHVLAEGDRVEIVQAIGGG